MIRGANLIAQALMSLAPHYEEIKVPCVVIQCVKALFILDPMRPANNPPTNGVIKAIKLNSYTDLFS